MANPLKLLIIEDSEDDTLLLLHELRLGGYEPLHTRVDAPGQLRDALASETWDIIISDYAMPSFSGLDAVKIVNDSGYDIPFIIVSGAIGEDVAVTVMKAGAHDYLIKGNLKRLVPAIQRELTEAAMRREGAAASRALHESERRFRVILENSRLVAVILDMEWRITFCNNFLLRLTGWEASQVQYGNWFELFVPADFRVASRKTYEELISQGLVPLHSESEILTRQGKLRFILWDNTILRDPQGKVTGIACIGTDITARKHAEIELRKLNEQLEERVRERTLQLETANQELAAYQRQLAAELHRAAEIQADLLPACMPQLPGFEMAARCLPAREVGGDFYDWQELEGGLLTFTLGDVMGKGIPAALLMATVRAILRATARQNPPAEALTITQQALANDLERSESFVTLFHAQLDLQSRRLTYVDAGHGHVFIYRANRAIEELKCDSTPLGIVPDQSYQQRELDFAPGDTLVLFSDGLLDARPDLDLNNNLFAASLIGASNAASMVDRLIALLDLKGVPPDDLTVLVLRCQGERPPGD